MKACSKFDYTTALINLPQAVRECSPVAIKCPEDILSACGDLASLAQESFQVLLLNSKNKLLNRVMVSLGCVNAAFVQPREVFRAAILANAVSILCFHNHPSGSIEPSAEDIKMSRELVEAGKIIGINVIDSVVLGYNEHGPLMFSMSAAGLL